MVDAFLFLFAFGGGLVAFISPCNVVAMPSFISYIGSQSNSSKKSILLSLSYSLGFCVMFATLSTFILFLTGFIRYTFWLKFFSGITIILLAIYVFFSKYFSKAPPIYDLTPNLKLKESDSEPDNIELNNENIDATNLDTEVMKHEGYTGAFLLGFSLGYSWIACITPIYLTVVILISTQADFLLGLVLFFIYALGIIIPFVIIGALIGTINKRIFVKLIKFGSKIQKIFALILLYVGIELLLSAFGIPGLIPFI